MTQQLAHSPRDRGEARALAPCRLYLVRHGTTTMNVENRYRGRRDIPLDAQEGMTSQEAARYDPEAFALYRTSPSRAACPRGERLRDAQDRMVAALQLIGSRHPGEAVATVTHAVMTRLVVSRLTGVEDERWRIPVERGSLPHLLVDNGSIAIAELPKGDDVD